MNSRKITAITVALLTLAQVCFILTSPSVESEYGVPVDQREMLPYSPSVSQLELAPPSILVYTEFVDDRAGEEYENTMMAINNTFGTDYQYTNLTDYTNLDTQLPGKDILLIPEQENANTTIMKTVGATWASTLTTFVNDGGVVVLLDFGNETAPGLGLHIYNESSLMQFGPVLGQYPSAALMEMNRLTFGDALGRQ
ncbi:MAG: hypothetical protein ACFFH0_05800, partial [Promethearchaeota archaeon]